MAHQRGDERELLTAGEEVPAQIELSRPPLRTYHCRVETISSGFSPRS